MHLNVTLDLLVKDDDEADLPDLEPNSTGADDDNANLPDLE